VTWLLFVGSPPTKPVPVDERTGLPLPPIKDTRAGTFSCCVDCAARPLDKLCCSGCPRQCAWSSSLIPRLAIRKD
jgi:hypothetical protein